MKKCHRQSSSAGIGDYQAPHERDLFDREYPTFSELLGSTDKRLEIASKMRMRKFLAEAIENIQSTNLVKAKYPLVKAENTLGDIPAVIADSQPPIAAMEPLLDLATILVVNLNWGKVLTESQQQFCNRHNLSIVKYPQLISKNLRTKQQQSSVKFNRKLAPQLPRSNGVELLLTWVLGGWAMMLLAIVLKLMTAGVLVAAIALTFGAGIKYWHTTVKLAHPQRQQPQERVRDSDWAVVNIPIDWSGVAANLMRSDVPSEAQKGGSEAFFLTHLQEHFPGWVDYLTVNFPEKPPVQFSQIEISFLNDRQES